MGKKFVSTSDKETAEKLRAEGFQEIPSDKQGKYLFINEGKANFSNDKVSFTNKMCI